MTRRLWISIGVVATLLVTVVGGVAALLSSESGLGWLVQRAMAYAPGELSVQAAHGRLRGPILLEGIVYRSRDAEVKLARLELDWNPWLLLRNEFHIARLTLTQLDYVALQAAAPTPAEIKLPNIILPVSVVVEQLQIDGLSYRGNPQQTPQVIDTVMLQAGIAGSIVEIAHLEVESAWFSLQANGRVQVWGDYPVNLDTHWSVRLPERVPLEGQGQIRGDLKRVTTQQQLTAPVAIKISASANEVFRNPHWELNVSAQGLDLNRLDVRGAFAPLDIELNAHNDDAVVQVGGKLHSTLPATGEFELSWQGRVTDANVAINLLEAKLSGSDTRLRLSGSVRVDADALYGIADVNLMGEWQALRWPLRGAPTVLSATGDFSLTGNPEKYNFAVSAPVTGAGFPKGDWSVHGRGDAQHVELTSVEIAALDGKIHGDAAVKWGGGTRWQARLSAEQLDPGVRWDGWPGRLAFELSSAGEVKDGHLRASAGLTKLTGRVRGYPLRAQAQVTLNDDVYELQGVELQSDSNVIRAGGTIANHWKLDWDINAPKLAALMPQLQGVLNARGQVRGPRDAPQISYSLLGENLRFDTTQAARVESRGELDFNESQPTHVTLQAKQLRVAAAPIDSIALELNGSLNAHRITGSLRAPKGGVDLAAAGQWREHAWNGQIERADVRQARFGEWKLEHAVALQASGTSAHAQELCWRSEAARLCADANWSTTAGGDAHMKLAGLPLSALQPFFPEGVGMTGVISGALEAHGQPRAQQALAITGTAQLQITPGQLTLTDVGGDVLNFEHRGADAQAVADAQGARIDAKADLAKLGTAALNIQLPKWQPGNAMAQQAISGRVQADAKDLGFLTGWIPAMEQVHGVLHTDVQIQGTVAQPRYEGLLSLREGAAVLPQQGIHLHDVSIDAHSRNDERIEFMASGRSGPGMIELKGNIGLDRAAGWPLTVEIKGKDFETVNLPEAWVLASPELQIYKVHNRIDLNGLLQIPEARYTARDVSKTQTPSSDVVLVGKDEKPRTDDKWQIYTTVRFSFGDKVSFYGFGLKGLVRGEVVAVDEPKKLTTGYGELQIVDATFNAYKIDLRVTRGRLLFAGGPINNPGIDARAIRDTGVRQPNNQFDNAETQDPNAPVAGVLVRGTLRNLELTLFSEPPRDQAEVLSLLLFGVPLGETTSEQGKALFLAASSLRLTGRDETVRKIGQKFGLQEIRLDAGTTPDQASLVIGRYLGPRLYINYSVGLLTNTTNVLRVRYRLSNKWLLQSEQSDVESAADLLYTFEH